MKPFIKNIFKFLGLALIPVLVLTIGYFHYDPFKVLRPYSDYSYPFVPANRDYISTEMYLKNEGQQHYNSFIFGSSRTSAYKPSSWAKYLSKDAKPFVFDASSESIYGIYTKLRFLDSMHTKIDNALIILCHDYSFAYEANHKGHLFIKHPKTSGESNMDFQLEFYKTYLSPRFLFCFYCYTFSGKFRHFMHGYIDEKKVRYDTINNEMDVVDQEQEITQTPVAYYEKRSKLFYERKGERTDTVQRISKNQMLMLEKVKEILEKNNTNYKVVLSPLYEQVKFSNADFSILKNVFGNRLYDFSGKNTFTDSMTNYYEQSHYRPSVGDSILSILYK